MADLLDQLISKLTPKKISILEFAESDMFCSKNLFPFQQVFLKLLFLEEMEGWEEDMLTHMINGGANGVECALSPNIRERRDWLRDAGFKHFRGVLLAGGRRSSKGFTTALAMGKVLYDTLLLEDPGTYYGIDPGKEIYFSCIAASEDQARKFQYKDLVSVVESCKAMEPNVIASLETEIRVATDVDLREIARNKLQGNKIKRDIARLRGNALASNASTIRGSATMVFTVDECAWLLPGESKSSAAEVFGAAEPSLDQFGIDGMYFLNSSPATKVGLFYDKYVEFMKPFDPFGPQDVFFDTEEGMTDNTNGDPRVMAFQFPSWFMFKDYQKSKKHKFTHVLTACPDWDPEEKNEDGTDKWSAMDKSAIFSARAAEAKNPDLYKVERRGQFAEVTEAYLDPIKVDRAFEGYPSEWELTENSPFPKLKLVPFPSNTGDKVSLSTRYKFHLDPASTTAGFGFAIGHVEWIDKWDGGQEEHCIIDMVKRWQGKDYPGKVIRYDEVLDEILEYAVLFRPYEITTDQFSSTDIIQRLQDGLNARNIPCRVREVYATAELNWKRYDVFKTSLYQELVHIPNDTEDTEWCKKEMKFLQQRPGNGRYPRVDRQESGPCTTKDMTDCVCIICHDLLGNVFATNARERLAMTSGAFGSPGGYSLSQVARPLQGGAGPENIQGYYKSEKERAAAASHNPARGVMSKNGRARSRRNKSRF